MLETVGPIDIASDADRVGMTGLQWQAIVICFLLYMVDGADILVMSFAAPSLSADWHLLPQTLGLCFSAGLAGMMAGTMFLAPRSDVYGRRIMIFVAICIVTSGMIVSGAASRIEVLILLRFYVGLGIGLMLATVTSLASEFAPKERRSIAVMFATAGYPAGAIATGLAAAAILPRYHWQGLFVAAGLASLVLLPISMIFLPESIEFLLARQPKGALERVNRLRQRMALQPLARLPRPAASDGKRLGVGTLLSPAYRRRSIRLWCAFLATYVTMYFVTSWLPKVTADSGFSHDSAILIGTMFNVGALLGTITIGMLSTIRDVTRLIVVFFLGAGLTMIGSALEHSSTWLLATEVLAIGMFIQGGFSGLVGITAKNYPTEFRTTGIGWALAAGRLGAVLGPIVGGVFIAMGAGLTASFILFGLPMLTAAAVVWPLRDGARAPAE